VSEQILTAIGAGVGVLLMAHLALSLRRRWVEYKVWRFNHGPTIRAAMRRSAR
jgi:hypothetical protein